MIARLKNPRTWLALAVAGIFTLLIWGGVQRVLNVAAVQNAVQRDFEIGFGAPGRECPEFLPEFIDSAAGKYLQRFAGSRSYEREWPVHTSVRHIIYQERFRAFFRGPIREVHVFYCEAFTGDLGAALQRFPGLRRVTVSENEPDVPTEADWKLLCMRLRSLPQLEEVELGGAWITDAAIAPLAGHPKLRSINISYGRLTSACAKTFAGIPRLTKLQFEEQIYAGDAWLTPEGQSAMNAALPAVSITYP